MRTLIELLVQTQDMVHLEIITCVQSCWPLRIVLNVTSSLREMSVEATETEIIIEEVTEDGRDHPIEDDGSLK